MQSFTTFAKAAEATAGEPSFFEALGIDWRLLLIQTIAFVILVWALGKFVYPWLMKSVDQRQADIESAAKASKHAQEAASDAQAETAKLIAQGRKEAAAIVATAKLEASDMVAASEERAKTSAERITSEAKNQLQKDIDAARDSLHDLTLELVAEATQKVVGATHTSKADDALIAQTVKGIKK